MGNIVSAMSRLMKPLRRFWRCGSRIGVPILPVIDNHQKAVRINVASCQVGENVNQMMIMNDVEAGGEDPEQPAKDNFIRKFLRVMRYIGMSNYNASRKPKITRCGVNYFINILLKGTFWTVVVLGIMSSFMDAKHYWLNFLEQGGLMRFLHFGFHVITILVQVFLLRLFAFLHGGINNMLEKVDELIPFDVDSKERQHEKRENRMLAAMVITTIVKCILKAGFDKALANWSIEFMIDRRSKFFYHDIGTWTFDNFANETFTDHLNSDLTQMKPAEKEMMGLLQVLLTFCSEMKLETAVDLVIVVGSCLLKYTRRLKKRVDNENHDDIDNDIATMESPSGNWAFYQKLAEVSKADNVVLDNLLMMMHTYNVMKFAYFLMKLLEKEATVLEFIYLLYSCGKVSVAYFIAKQSNGYNSEFQLWMTNWGLRSNDPVFIQKALLAVKKMELSLLGLGTGEFIIGESFVLKFGGMVGSMFMLHIDKADVY